MRGEQEHQRTLPSLDRALLKLASNPSMKIGEITNNTKVLHFESRKKSHDTMRRLENNYSSILTDRNNASSSMILKPYGSAVKSVFEKKKMSE